MKAFVVMCHMKGNDEDICDDNHVVGIFTSRKKAEEARSRHHSENDGKKSKREHIFSVYCDIEEHEVQE